MPALFAIEKVAEHATLLKRIPQMQDLQCLVLALVLRCIKSKLHPSCCPLPNRVSISRCVTTQESEGASNSCLHIPVSDEVWQMATLQFSSGGLGLRNAERLRPTAHWASWADTLPVVRRRHPGIADHLMLSLLRSTGGFHLEAAK